MDDGIERIRAKFGGPVVAVYDRWLVMARPHAPTLGSLVVASRLDATAFGALPPEAFTELHAVLRDAEDVLRRAVGAERVNYLAFMMVEPHVHFHAVPRYEGTRAHGDLALTDVRWPGPADLSTATALPPARLAAVGDWLRGLWTR